MSSSLSKRKLDDYTGDSTSPTDHLGAAATRMRKDQTDIASPSCCRSPVSDPPRLQFFVRLLSGLHLVLQASSIDTILTVHEMIQSSTRIRIIEQRLIYCGKQLQREQTLEECGVEKDAVLHLTGKMRSTGYPKACLISDDIRNFIFFLLQNNPPVPMRPPLKTIRSLIDQLMYTIPEDDPKGTIGHLHIFATSLAPQALVRLYISCHKPNREAADGAVKHFINLVKTKTPGQADHQCVAVVLEFCRLLSITVGFSDSLYIFCRSSLGTMMGCADIEERKGLIGLRDIFPFVKDIAGKVAISLILSPDSHCLSGPLLEDVRDFSAFLGPVRKEIKESVLFSGPIRIPFGEEISMLHVGHVEEISYFHWFFLDLLDKMDKCLTKYEEDVDWVVKNDCQAAFTGWSQHLTILKELHSISKLYYRCEELFWETMKRRKDAVCYLIVKHAKRSDDNKWILECKEVTNFEARRHLSMLMLPEVKYEYDQLHEMLIDRSHLLAESFEYIAHADLRSLRSGLFMEFKNEEATGPGVLREWFFLVCQEIFNTQNALFVACPNDRRRFFPNPASKVDPLHLEYFSFSGRVIALALMHKVQVGIVFDRAFFLQLAGHSISLEDIREADPYLYSSCKQILNMDPETVDQDALGLTFVNEVDELGTRKIVELIPNGKAVVVNSKNRKQYVDALIQHRFVVATREQMTHFARGFADIMSCPEFKRSFFDCLEPEDLDYMLRGSESEISIDDWKLHTDYHGFNETDPQISWFWKVVGDMTKEQKKVLLFFWTSIKHLPVEGFRGLASRVYIYRSSEPSDRLPSSHTCFYRICFPEYPSLSVTHDRLQIITQEHVCCSFGTW